MPNLLDLPTELLERILTLLCHENAQSIQACRQSCLTLNTIILAIITQSQLVQYLEHVALLGMYDPLLHVGFGAAAATLALPDRVAALRAYEESWNAFAGGDDGDARFFLRERAPNLRIALPPWQHLWLSSPQVRYILATIIDPDPSVGLEQDGDGELDRGDLFSFGPWFITATRTGFNVRASYSYLDLHGFLGGAGGAGGGGGGEAGAPGGIQIDKENGDQDGNQGAEYDRVHWTVIKVPVWNVMGIVLSTELDLAVVISARAKVELNGLYEKNTHLAVRPLRFRDGVPHPCAKVPTIRFSVTHVPVFATAHAQVIGDYLLLWFGNFGVRKLYLVAWKQGSITLLREDLVEKYGTVHMISDDVLALVQLDPPGIELCRVSSIEKKEVGEGGGGGDDDDGPDSRLSRHGGPRMDKLCTLLLPPLRQRRDGSRARVRWVYCDGEHPGHHMFSHGPWPEYRGSPLGRRQMFRHSTKDSILSVMLQVNGCEGRSCIIDVVVRCATLLAYADGAQVIPTVVADAASSNGAGGEQLASAQAQAVVGDRNADKDADTVAGTDDDGVPWDAWGPRATAVSNHPHIGSRFLVGERKVTIDQDIGKTYIRDYNPHRIRQARASMMAEGLDGHRRVDSHEEETANIFHLKGTRRIIESSTIQGGEWFEEDVTTSLPHLESEVDLAGSRCLYLEQDKVLLSVDNLDKITGRPSRMGDMEAFVLYNM